MPVPLEQVTKLSDLQEAWTCSHELVQNLNKRGTSHVLRLRPFHCLHAWLIHCTEPLQLVTAVCFLCFCVETRVTVFVGPLGGVRIHQIGLCFLSEVTQSQGLFHVFWGARGLWEWIVPVSMTIRRNPFICCLSFWGQNEVSFWCDPGTGTKPLLPGWNLIFQQFQMSPFWTGRLKLILDSHLNSIRFLFCSPDLTKPDLFVAAAHDLGRGL